MALPPRQHRLHAARDHGGDARARQAHDFHRHPRQEELITVQDGIVIQYLDRESARLSPGDSVHVGMDVVHATFNIGDEPTQILVVIGPAIGPDSYELVDVAHEQPWTSIERPANPFRQ